MRVRSSIERLELDEHVPVMWRFAVIMMLLLLLLTTRGRAERDILRVIELVRITQFSARRMGTPIVRLLVLVMIMRNHRGKRVREIHRVLMIPVLPECIGKDRLTEERCWIERPVVVVVVAVVGWRTNTRRTGLLRIMLLLLL